MRGKVFNEEWILDGATHERIKHQIVKELDNLDRLIANGNLIAINKAVHGFGDYLTDADIRFGEVTNKPVPPAVTTPTYKMEKGKRYMIVYRTAPKRAPRNCVLEYLDEDETHYWLNARPVAGTQSIPKSWVMSIREVSKLVAIRP